MAFFFVGVDHDATREQRDTFTNYLRDSPAGFWHHISHSWLIVDSSEEVTAENLRDKLCEFMPNINTVVIMATPEDFAAFSPESSHKWLDKYLGD